jgi:hypothetical protein
MPSVIIVVGKEVVIIIDDTEVGTRVIIIGADVVGLGEG